MLSVGTFIYSAIRYGIFFVYPYYLVDFIIKKIINYLPLNKPMDIDNETILMKLIFVLLKLVIVYSIVYLSSIIIPKENIGVMCLIVLNLLGILIMFSKWLYKEIKIMLSK